ncbi:MAG: putative transporter, partial [Ramlibacter sp.]|nr:putative transporter [Ramlibacter sp.]
MSATSSPARPLAIATAGLVALAVAMGIGRFAFTPLLPIMMAEGSVTLPGASLLASANYFGYLLGAIACTFQPWLWTRLGWTPAVNGPALVRAGLVATGILTAAMAWHWPAGWVLWRFAAGLASAVVFLYTSGFCLDQLARRQLPAMGALIYTGPGLGIVISGLAASAMVAWQAPAAFGWVAFGVLALALSAMVWPVFDARRAVPAAVQ